MKHLFLAFLAGVASACGFAPLGLWPVTLLSLALLLWLVETAPRLRSALARGYWFGAGQFMLGLNWIATAFTYQANMPAWLGWVAVVLLSLYLAVYPATAAGLAWRHGRRGIGLVLALAAAWIVTEWLRATLFTGFAWNPAGVSLQPTYVAYWATIIGTYGLSGIALMLAGILYLLARRQRRTTYVLLGSLAVGTALLALSQPSPDRRAGIAIRIVQPNIGQEDKWRDGFAEESLARLAQLSQAGVGGPRLLLWPEAAVTEPLQDARRDPLRQLLAEQRRIAVARMLGPNDLLMTGGITIASSDGVDATGATNSIFAIDARARIIARYDKAHLVPYGEYLPARPLLSRLGLSRLAPGDIDFAPGPGPRTLMLPALGKVGFQLCYEIIFSGEVVDRADRPAFLFNPSNDAWFGAWGPPQHLAQARLRALEEGLPVIRATPTGISAVIDADGKVLQSVPWRTWGVIDTQLPLPKPPTLFARFGNILPLGFALLLAAAAIAVRRKAG